MTPQEQLIKNKRNFIQISPHNISYGFGTLNIQELDGSYSWYIPSFDIYFSSKTKEQGNERARAMVKSFFNFWLTNQGFRAFALQLFKLGYKTSTHAEFKNLLNRTNLKATLKSSLSKLPPEFEGSEVLSLEGDLSIAV